MTTHRKEPERVKSSSVLMVTTLHSNTVHVLVYYCTCSCVWAFRL